MTRALISALLLWLPLAATAQQDPCQPAQDPETLAAIDEALLGLPVMAAGTPADGHRDVWCHDRFCLQYNAVTRGPDWVIERLGPDVTDGAHTRPKIKFAPDPTAQARQLHSAVDADYTNSGFDRGHMAASADFKCSADWMEQTFVLSNAVPQVGVGFNRAIWKSLEERVQGLARWEPIYVITGPIPLPADGKAQTLSAHASGCGNIIELPGRLTHGRDAICNGSKDPAKDCADGVAIPVAVFKVIYVPRTGRAFGFVLSNENHSPLRNKLNVSADTYLDRWRVSLTAIEDLAGLEFFPRSTARRQTVVESNCPVTRWR